MKTTPPRRRALAAGFVLRARSLVLARNSPARVTSLLLVCLALNAAMRVDGDTNAAPATDSQVEETNRQETLRAYVQLQEQLHAAQMAIEETRKEARDAALQNADTLARKLDQIEQAVEAQRARELEAMQSANRVMLMVAGAFATIGFLAMVFMAYFQWRTVNGLAELAGMVPSSRLLGSGPVRGALGAGEGSVVSVSPAEQSSLRLLSALENLEKRIRELEHTTRPAPVETSPLSDGAEPGSGISGSGNGQAEPAALPAQPTVEDRIRGLLGKGQALLHTDSLEAALACFEEVLRLAPNHPEALVNKGAACERMQRLDEALACYDRAIAGDDSLTVAYLHKGGLFNRLERYAEALQCYEQALRTQERRHNQPLGSPKAPLTTERTAAGPTTGRPPTD